MNQQSEATESAQGRPRSPSLRFVVLLGVVSLFADMTYEGARSVTGPFLAVLGASGTAVGLIAGLGELIGYSLRLASGYLADRTGRYWAITLVGYGLNMIAVPLLALAGRWEIAAALMICERVGKAIRTPAPMPCSHTPPTRSAMAGVSGCTRRWTRPGQSSGP